MQVEICDEICKKAASDEAAELCGKWQTLCDQVSLVVNTVGRKTSTVETLASRVRKVCEDCRGSTPSSIENHPNTSATHGSDVQRAS
jgi:hypothetical protein